MTTDGADPPKLTLTFDNGPTPGITEQVLDVLGGRGITATFFAIGTQLRQPGGQALARRAIAEGHRVGHHTTTHSVLLGAAESAEEAVESEIAAFASEMEEYDGAERLFRPYAAGGVLDHRVFSEAAVRYLMDNGYTCVLWNSLPHDWDDPSGWVDRALLDVGVLPWTVAVLHDIDSGAMDRLPDFLDEASNRGIEIVSSFPDSCVPIRRGHLVHTLAQLTMETSS
jgi:peptidoglycan-N-acetylglucosamine deacetylase